MMEKCGSTMATRTMERECFLALHLHMVRRT
jgi:hypothetical protein